MAEGDNVPTSQERRKSSKPLMEKRRRARINECLGELQGILEVVNGQSEAPPGHSKREKAEILEQTVELVKRLRHQDPRGIANAEPVPQAQYRAGFNECLSQVNRFMDSNNSALNAETRSGLLNHLAGTLRSSVSFNSDGREIAVDGPVGAPSSRGSYPGEVIGIGPVAAPGSSVTAAGNHHHLRPALERRACPPLAPGPSQLVTAITAPPPPPPLPRASVPPLALAPPPTASNQSPQVSKADVLAIQQRVGEPPTAQIQQAQPPPASSGVTLAVNAQSAPGAAAGHVALVLPAQLLSSLVGGQFTTGQVIPLYQQPQANTPMIGGQQLQSSGASVVLPAGSNVAGGAYSSPTPLGEVTKVNAQCVTTPISSAGSGQIFIVPAPSFGYAPPTVPVPVNGVVESPPSSTPNNTRRETGPALSPPVAAPSSLVAVETRGQNGVVYAPASLPMHLYVSPSAYSGGASGPFANGHPLPNSPSLALGPHWRPWGWEPDQR